MSTRNRTKYLLTTYGQIIAVALVIIGLAVAGLGIQDYRNPPVEQTPPQEFDVQSFSVDTSYSAELVRETPLYDTNRLVNQPVYLLNLSPTLDLSTTLDLPENQPVDVELETFMRYEAAFEGEQFASDRRELSSVSQTVNDGQLTVNTTISIPDIQADLTAFSERLNGVGETSNTLQLTVAYESPQQEGSGTYSGQLTDTTSIQFLDNAYFLPNQLGDSATDSQTTPGETVQQSPDLTGALQFVGVGVGLLLLGGGVFFWQSRITGLEELELQIYLDRYDEWISEGEFPTGSESQYIYVSSVKDLVDIAIDTSGRVIYDVDVEALAVAEAGIIYYYTTDPQAVSSWLNLSEVD
jgi:hypothetical protein